MTTGSETEGGMSLYRPGSGTEGDCFFNAWCRQCQRDKAMREGCHIDECDDDERCDIIARSYVGNVDEWRYDKDGRPCCTAFVPAGQPIPIRDDKTIDMFDEGRAA